MANGTASTTTVTINATSATVDSNKGAADIEGKPIWEMNGPQVEQWIRTTNTLFPKGSMPENERAQKMATGSILLQNILQTVRSVLHHQQKLQQEAQAKKAAAEAAAAKENNNQQPPAKKQKTDDTPPPIHDPFLIWLGQNEEPPTTGEGAILAQLSTAGWTNALARHTGGLVNSKLVGIVAGLTLMTPIPTANNVTFGQLRKMAVALQRVTQTRMEADFLLATPRRITQMLCPDVAPHEFKSIRRRVYETVIEGKGRNTGQGAEEEADIPVAKRIVEHEIERDKICRVCGNKDQAEFTLDRKNGDIICTHCGAVAMESLMHEGSQFRKFEGEADRNHHGDAPNKLYSNAHNMATTLGGVQITSSAGGPGFGTQKKGIENLLRNTNAYTELNISQFGKGERKTRTGYKDRQKKDAFVQMTHVGDALHLHEAVVQRAKELFAGFRDDRELVQAFKGVVAACLCVAFDQLSKEGLQIMRARQQEDCDALLSNRATRRNELHNASMAGKGGLQLDFSKVEAAKREEAEMKKVSPLEEKPTATWDLADCRSWLLEASRNIAAQWMKDRKAGKTANVPQGTQQELEGKLVQHTIRLCNALEQELKAKNSKKGGVRRAAITPRVGDLGHLSIRWQHSHERGSGGKGGVGNSGHAAAAAKGGRTAGQVLILKTAKKLASLLGGDRLSGEAFHKELRGVVGRQDARKLLQRRAEAARQRRQQMKRKPWLQARATEEAAQEGK